MLRWEPERVGAEAKGASAGGYVGKRGMHGRYRKGVRYPNGVRVPDTAASDAATAENVTDRLFSRHVCGQQLFRDPVRFGKDVGEHGHHGRWGRCPQVLRQPIDEAIAPRDGVVDDLCLAADSPAAFMMSYAAIKLARWSYHVSTRSVLVLRVTCRIRKNAASTWNGIGSYRIRAPVFSVKDLTRIVSVSPKRGWLKSAHIQTDRPS